MFVAAVLAALLLSQAPTSPLERQGVGPISFVGPPGWRRSFRFGTVRFDDPSGGGYVLVDTSQVLRATAMAPQECRDKAVSNLGAGTGWVGYVVGEMPAANQVIVEASAVGNSIVTSRWVGCDGVNIWSMLFEVDGDHYRRIEPFIIHIMKTLRYENSPGGEVSGQPGAAAEPPLSPAPPPPTRGGVPVPSPKPSVRPAPLPRSR